MVDKAKVANKSRRVDLAAKADMCSQVYLGDRADNFRVDLAVRMGKSRKVDLKSESGLEVYLCSHSYVNILKTFWKHFCHVMEFVVDIPNVIILAKPLNHEDVYFYIWRTNYL